MRSIKTVLEDRSHFQMSNTLQSGVSRQALIISDGTYFLFTDAGFRRTSGELAVYDT